MHFLCRGGKKGVFWATLPTFAGWVRFFPVESVECASRAVIRERMPVTGNGIRHETDPATETRRRGKALRATVSNFRQGPDLDAALVVGGRQLPPVRRKRQIRYPAD